MVETLVDHAAPGDGEQPGLLHGRIRYEGAFAVLDRGHALAPWLLGDATLAGAYNTAYERVYPGALTELGIPATAFSTAAAWARPAVPVYAALRDRAFYGPRYDDSAPRREHAVRA
ncbi:hypothetical protein ACH4FA_29930 [Streptomyces sp. NPDC017966]|uniref:hypothetical protein n=1 Tax=Streptomyces sp. NPDC017966 TaxID=3365023 RepID=UPI003790620C